MRHGDILVLGFGNDLLGDDAVGLMVVAALKDDGVPVQMSSRSGLELLDAVVGRRKVLLIDSQVTGAPPGTVAEYPLTPGTVRSPSTHYLGYGEALAIAASLGLTLPQEIRVLAVERTPDVQFGDSLSEAVAAAMPAVVARARAIVTDWLGTKGASVAA